MKNYGKKQGNCHNFQLTLKSFSKLTEKLNAKLILMCICVCSVHGQLIEKLWQFFYFPLSFSIIFD